VVFLGDMPMISPLEIDAVINAYKFTEMGIVIPVFNSNRGHPILISFKYRSEIEKLDADVGLHYLAKKFPDDVLEVEMNTPGILKDIDTQEDYQINIKQTR
jgi:molybdenum cofactor cytidylyltransferase